ncbi:MAG: hypothetical protein AB7Y74_14200 [Syntrophorhabdus sp.]
MNQPKSLFASLGPLRFDMILKIPSILSKNHLDRINRIDRMFSPFPGEKEKEPLPSANTMDGRV